MELYCSYNWLKKITKTKKSPAEVAALLSEFGPTVERVVDWGSMFEGMVVGRIVEVLPHPDADKLRKVLTDVGDREVQIVCGGSNLEPDQLVAVALPGAKVRWHGEGDLVELEETKIRGEKSFGMICGAAEIGLEKWFPVEDDHVIMDISFLKVKAGVPLAEAFSLDDTVFEIEVTSNRPDMMSMEGIVRELMAIEGKTMELPKAQVIKGGSAELSVKVEDVDLCPRYQAVKIDGVKVGPSPMWMQSALFKAGIRPINNLVDISNYVLIEQGQPMHAFDGEKVERIGVRRAKDGEEFLALDEETYTLDDSMLVITDGEKSIAIAGVMGGEESGISELTNSIIWESANFEPVNIRRTARKLLLFSESQARFDKGLSTFSTQRALDRAVELTLEFAGGDVVSGVVDTAEKAYEPIVYDFNPADIARVCGFNISLDEARSSLERLGFKVEGSKKWKVTVPFWRDHDLEEPRDLIEEIARLYGYARVEGTIPSGVSSVTDPSFATGRRVSDYLIGKGFAEMISYSMIGADDISKLDDEVDEYVHIANPLSSDAEYMRVSMLPSVLHAVKRNEARFSDGRLFEVANLYTKVEDDVPNEDMYVMCAMWGDDDLFGCLKGVLEGLIDADYEAGDFDNLHPGRTALLHVDDEELGVIGEVHPHTLKQFGVDSRVVVCQMRLDVLVAALAVTQSFESIPEFPGVKRDVAFFIDDRKSFVEIENALVDADDLVASVELFDVYQGKGVPGGKKSMAFHIEYRDDGRTLAAGEADAAHEKLMKVVKKLGGEVRG